VLGALVEKSLTTAGGVTRSRSNGLVTAVQPEDEPPNPVMSLDEAAGPGGGLHSLIDARPRRKKSTSRAAACPNFMHHAEILHRRRDAEEPNRGSPASCCCAAPRPRASSRRAPTACASFSGAAEVESLASRASALRPRRPWIVKLPRRAGQKEDANRPAFLRSRPRSTRARAGRRRRPPAPARAGFPTAPGSRRRTGEARGRPRGANEGPQAPADLLSPARIIENPDRFRPRRARRGDELSRCRDARRRPSQYTVGAAESPALGQELADLRDGPGMRQS